MAKPLYIEYFDLHGMLGRGFFHPGGKKATERLLSYLPPLIDSSLLVEVGSGAGETAKLVLDHGPCNYVGIDASPAMLARARQRVGVKNDRAKFIECDLWNDRLPLPDESADAIIAESVICVLDPQKILAECYRVLKKGGVLAWNERIFGEGVSPQDARLANEFTRELLGVDAASLELRTASDWKRFCGQMGFTMTASERFHDTRAEDVDSGPAARLRRLGFLLRYPGELRFLVRERRIARKFEHVWQKSEQWIFVAKK